MKWISFWIIYVSLSVFKWLRVITGEFVKFGPFGSLCVISDCEKNNVFV